MCSKYFLKWLARYFEHLLMRAWLFTIERNQCTSSSSWVGPSQYKKFVLAVIADVLQRHVNQRWSSDYRRINWTTWFRNAWSNSRLSIVKPLVTPPPLRPLRSKPVSNHGSQAIQSIASFWIFDSLQLASTTSWNLWAASTTLMQIFFTESVATAQMALSIRAFKLTRLVIKTREHSFHICCGEHQEHPRVCSMIHWKSWPHESSLELGSPSIDNTSSWSSELFVSSFLDIMLRLYPAVTILNLQHISCMTRSCKLAKAYAIPKIHHIFVPLSRQS